MFIPAAKPVIVVSGDGSLAAIHEPSRVVVVELPSCAPFAELTVGSDSDIAWVGTPPRLLVLAQDTARLVDPFGSRTIAELKLESPMKLSASVGNHALLVGAQGTAILVATDRTLVIHPFPIRSRPTAAGAAGSQLMVAVGGVIEEWDPQSRMPKRRLKLPRAETVTRVGGSDRVVWITTNDARIDVIPLVDRGQPKFHELPEPIAMVAAHPHSDLLAVIGADTGRIWVVDLDGRNGLRLISAEGIDRADAVSLMVGRAAGVLAAQTDRPLAAAPIDEMSGRVKRNTEVPVRVDDPATMVTPDAFAGWRDRAKHSRAMTVEPMRSLWLADPGWRDALVAWRSSPTAKPPSSPVTALVARLELTPDLAPAVAFLYATHLAGEDGAAPVAIARVLDGRWDEALGRGELAQRNVTAVRDSRVRLAQALLRVLDELPPSTGTLVGTPGPVSLVGPCTIVAAGPLAIIAEACLSSIGGAIVAAHSDADPHELVLEARAYGAAAMLRVTADDLDGVPTEEPIVLVVADDATADQLGVPRLK